MNRFRFLMFLSMSIGLVMGGVGVGQAAARQLQAPKAVVATATSTTAISVSFSPTPGASSYTVYLYPTTGRVLQAYPNATPTGTSISELTRCTTYRVSVQAISSSGNVLSSVQSGKIAVTTPCNNAALVPSFGTPTPTSDGFTVRITNYDADFTWAVDVTDGSSTIDDSGLVTVTGLSTDEQQIVTVTTTRDLYDSGSATISGARAVVISSWIGAGDFTIEFWVKPTVDWSTLGRQELFVLLPTVDNARFDIAYEGGAWYVFHHNLLTNGTLPSHVSMAPPATGTWTHIAMTKQSDTFRLYVAGQKIAESIATFDLTNLNQVLLGADPNTSWCRCNVATALLSNVRVVNGTALYTGTTLTAPTSPLTNITGTTFLLNSALGLPSLGSVVFDGATRYEQAINTVEGVPVLTGFNAFRLVEGTWQSSTVVTSSDSPFIS